MKRIVRINVTVGNSSWVIEDEPNVSTITIQDDRKYHVLVPKPNGSYGVVASFHPDHVRAEYEGDES